MFVVHGHAGEAAATGTDITPAQSTSALELRKSARKRKQKTQDP
jgi:hypothetical protein